MMGLKTQLVPMLLLESQNSYLYLYILFNISVTLSAKHVVVNPVFMSQSPNSSSVLFQANVSV